MLDFPCQELRVLLMHLMLQVLYCVSSSVYKYFPFTAFILYGSWLSCFVFSFISSSLVFSSKYDENARGTGWILQLYDNIKTHIKMSSIKEAPVFPALPSPSFPRCILDLSQHFCFVFFCVYFCLLLPFALFLHSRFRVVTSHSHHYYVWRYPIPCSKPSARIKPRHYRVRRRSVILVYRHKK